MLPTSSPLVSAAAESTGTSLSADRPRGLVIDPAANYLGVTIWFMRTLVWSKQIPYSKFGKRLVFDRHDLDRFLEANKTPVSLPVTSRRSPKKVGNNERAVAA